MMSSFLSRWDISKVENNQDIEQHLDIINNIKGQS